MGGGGGGDCGFFLEKFGCWVTFPEMIWGRFGRCWVAVFGARPLGLNVASIAGAHHITHCRQQIRHPRIADAQHLHARPDGHSAGAEQQQDVWRVQPPLQAR